MLAPWLADAASRDLIAEWSRAAGVELAALGSDADAATIAQTQYAQPLIVAAGLLSLGALDGFDVLPDRIVRLDPGDMVVAGHSLGAITAAAVAGVFSPSDAIKLAAARGRLMAETPTDGGMLAVIGANLADVQAAAAQAGVAVATVNAPTQIVVAGPKPRLAQFAPPAKSRIVALPVSGPFHTAAYREAGVKLAALPANTNLASPRIPLIRDIDGKELSPGTPPEAIRKYLVAQISTPVRWDKVTSTLLDLGVTETTELEPSGTLTRLWQRALRGLLQRN